MARGVYVSKLMRNMVELPLLPGTVLHRGDILTVLGSKRHVEAVIAKIGYADRPVDTTDLAFVGWGIFLGGLVGTLAITMGGFPISLSTTGGALLSGLLLGWLRTVHPTFGRIPGPSLWLMNTLGLNVFIAVIGITAGPGFIAGLQQAGIALAALGDRGDVLADDLLGLCRALRLQVSPGHPVRGLRRCTYYHGGAGDDTGSGPKPNSRAGIRDALCHRKHRC